MTRRYGLLGKRGALLIEFAFTVPIVVNIILFGLELVKIYLTQTAIDTICKECTFSLITVGKVSEFDRIFQKHLPGFCKIGRAKYYCRVYEDIAKMMSISPYGGECIGFPYEDNFSEEMLPTASAISDNFGLGNHAIYMNGESSENNCSQKDVKELKRVEYLQTGVPAGHTFVLTVVYRHEFSSSLVKTLFAGGSNTNHEDVYMLWSRGSGIVDKRDES